MPNYKLSVTAETNLVRIYHWGFKRYGHFEQLAEQPLSHPVTDIREGYRRVNDLHDTGRTVSPT